jgi:formylglycine-generating enzyme
MMRYLATIIAAAMLLFSCASVRTDRDADGRVQPEMILVPGGVYTVGTDSASENEGPAHRVKIASFMIDKYEVTNAQYMEFMKGTDYPSPPRWRPDGTFWPEQADLPVSWVSWDDANAYAVWRGVRLPTEHEWEIAARCTSAYTYPWGDSLLIDGRIPANLAGPDDGFDLETAPVHAFPSGVSCWGAHNLAGNVWEWVQDWYLPAAYHSLVPDGEATVGSDSLFNQRVIRGGSWLDDAEAARITKRSGFEPSYRSDVIGFRCAMDAE